MNLLVRRAAALADENRVRILQDLLESEATVSDLGARLVLPQPRVSTHLKILHDAGLVAVEPVGRQRTYRVDASRVAQILTALGATETAKTQLSRPSTQAAREVQRNSALRQARTCYDHLAGVAGVQFLDELLKHRWLTITQDGSRPRYDLTPEGMRALSRRGVELENAAAERRAFAYGCPDWTERRPHLAGALGAAVFKALKDTGMVRRKPASRAVALLRPLSEWLDAQLHKKERKAA